MLSSVQTWDTDGFSESLLEDKGCVEMVAGGMIALKFCHLSLTGPGENSAPGITCQQSSVAPTQKRDASIIWKRFQTSDVMQMFSYVKHAIIHI